MLLRIIDVQTKITELDILTKTTCLGNEGPVCPQSLRTKYLIYLNQVSFLSKEWYLQTVITLRPLYALKWNANKRCFVLKAVLVPVLVQGDSMGGIPPSLHIYSKLGMQCSENGTLRNRCGVRIWLLGTCSGSWIFTFIEPYFAFWLKRGWVRDDLQDCVQISHSTFARKLPVLLG